MRDSPKMGREKHMMNSTKPLLLVLLALSGFAACGGHPARVDLGVDVYLHPDSAQPRDLILQSAIRERLDQIAAKRRDQVYVRVFNLTAFLSGAVKDPCSKDEAQRAAEATKVTVEDSAGTGQAIQAKHVENQVEVTSGKTCEAGSR
jgi:hypothetical protein